MWIGIDAWYPHIGSKSSIQTASNYWNPMRQFGEGSALAWFFIVVRLGGSSLVVPPIEEVFFRSFLYRYIVKQDFQKVALNYFGWMPFLATSLIFGFEHSQWLAGILCGMVYQWLVIRKGRLGDAITAHAITNFLLGVWVLWRGDWKFW
jgi:CAAX prenyl protease-like protein